MIRIVAGAVLVVAALALLIFGVYPLIMTTVGSQFQNSDLGLVVGIAVCFFVTGAYLWLAGLVIVLVLALLPDR